MPDIKAQITDAADEQFSQLPDDIEEGAREQFTTQQGDFASKITHAFSDSLRQIFIVASGLMFVATILVFTVKERVLKTADAADTPGEA